VILSQVKLRNKKKKSLKSLSASYTDAEILSYIEVLKEELKEANREEKVVNILFPRDINYLLLLSVIHEKNYHLLKKVINNLESLVAR